MTKAIRIENADNSKWKVRVYTEDFINGEWVRDPKPVALDYPTAMTTDKYITSSRRLVVEEAGE